MKTTVQITENNFSPDQKEAMWQLYSSFYHYSKEYFLERLDGIRHFVLFHHGEQLIGFSGLRIDRIKSGWRTNLMIYFGQVVIAPQFRGRSLLPLTGAALCRKYWKYLITGRIFFWCDALTYKAYLVFAKTLDRFYPSSKEVMPQKVRQLRDHIGRLHYGDAFCPETGVVSKTSRLVNDATVLVYEKDLKDQDIRYYVRLNPEHVKGNGLITLAPVSWKNLLLLGMRALRKSLGLGKNKTQKTKSPVPAQSLSGLSKLTIR